MSSSLEGQFLVAMPGMFDPRFVDSVIYLIGHNDDGAMGLVVNHPIPELRFADVLDELEIDTDEPHHPPMRKLSVLQGGPVDTGRGFVLHSKDYFQSGNSYCINNEICLTATLDVLRAVAWSEAPTRSLFALGYCGWAPGQLEDEIKANGWLTTAGSQELLFELPLADRYDAALAAMGINRASLSADAGRA